MRHITSDPEDLKVIEELERLSMDDYFRYMYNGKEVDERLMNSRYEEGMEEKQVEIAKNLLKLGNNSIADISKVTGLTIEEIESLQNDSD